jgi:predicted DNA-binding protein (MmcQ/YjbR family)
VCRTLREQILRGRFRLGYVDADALQELCLAFAGSEESYPFSAGLACFKVAGKLFALSRLAEQPLRVSLKCEPGLAEQLRAAHPEIVPGYHLNKRHWTTVALDGSLPDQMVADMVQDSYDLVVSAMARPRRRALRWAPDNDRCR